MRRDGSVANRRRNCCKFTTLAVTIGAGLHVVNFLIVSSRHNSPAGVQRQGWSTLRGLLWRTVRAVKPHPCAPNFAASGGRRVLRFAPVGRGALAGGGASLGISPRPSPPPLDNCTAFGHRHPRYQDQQDHRLASHLLGAKTAEARELATPRFEGCEPNRPAPNPSPRRPRLPAGAGCWGNA